MLVGTVVLLDGGIVVSGTAVVLVLGGAVVSGTVVVLVLGGTVVSGTVVEPEVGGAVVSGTDVVLVVPIEGVVNATIAPYRTPSLAVPALVVAVTR